MKKKILLVLLFLNILPIFATAQNVVSSDTAKTNVLKTIEKDIKSINEKSSKLEEIEKSLKSINEKTLKTEDVKVLLEENKKEEKNSPIWMISLVISLFVGIFIFISIAMSNLKHVPYAIAKLMRKELSVIIWICIGCIILFFLITIFCSKCIVLFQIITIISFLLAGWMVRRLIIYLNINNLIKPIFKSNPIEVKDTLEFYINKREFNIVYDLLNAIKSEDNNFFKVFKKNTVDVEKNSILKVIPNCLVADPGTQTFLWMGLSG